MSENPRLNQAADFSNDPSNLCNDFFSLVKNNIANCGSFELFDDNLKFFSKNSDSLTLMHFSVGSLHKHFDELGEFLALLFFKSDVICLFETCKQQPLTNMQINGYDLVNDKP